MSSASFPNISICAYTFKYRLFDTPRIAEIDRRVFGHLKDLWVPGTRRGEQISVSSASFPNISICAYTSKYRLFDTPRIAEIDRRVFGHLKDLWVPGTRRGEQISV